MCMHAWACTHKIKRHTYRSGGYLASRHQSVVSLRRILAEVFPVNVDSSRERNLALAQLRPATCDVLMRVHSTMGHGFGLAQLKPAMCDVLMRVHSTTGHGFGLAQLRHVLSLHMRDNTRLVEDDCRLRTSRPCPQTIYTGKNCMYMSITTHCTYSCTIPLRVAVGFKHLNLAFRPVCDCEFYGVEHCKGAGAGVLQYLRATNDEQKLADNWLASYSPLATILRQGTIGLSPSPHYSHEQAYGKVCLYYLPSTILKHRHVDVVVCFADAYTLREEPDGLGSVPSSSNARDGRHARIRPSLLYISMSVCKYVCTHIDTFLIDDIGVPFSHKLDVYK